MNLRQKRQRLCDSCDMFLCPSQAQLDVEDLFTDLADGKNLLKLLEIISSEKLGRPNNGRMRVHQIENVNRSLAFLHTKVVTLPHLVKPGITF